MSRFGLWDRCYGFTQVTVSDRTRTTLPSHMINFHFRKCHSGGRATKAHGTLRLTTSPRGWAHFVWPCSIFGSCGARASCSHSCFSCSLPFDSFSLYFSLRPAGHSRLLRTCLFSFSKECALSIPG